jgi:hypothetical protein
VLIRLGVDGGDLDKVLIDTAGGSEHDMSEVVGQARQASSTCRRRSPKLDLVSRGVTLAPAKQA